MMRRRSFRSNHLTVVTVIVIGLTFHSPRASASGPGSLLAGDGDGLRAEQLVEQLGAVSYQRREHAADLLEEIGAPALPVLRNAVDHRDLEVRYRARELYDVIERAEQQRILSEFPRDRSGELGRLLPGWERFSGIVGRDASARMLFVSMYRAEPDIMRLVDRPSDDLRAAVEERVLQFRAAKGNTRGSSMSPPTAAVLLFVVLDPNVDVQGTVHEILSVLFSQRSIQAALTESGDNALRRLVSTWVAKADDVSPSQRVAVAVLYDFESGVIPSLELIHSAARGNHIQNAIFSVAKLGGPQNLRDLEALLDDDSVMSERESGGHGDLTATLQSVSRFLEEFTDTMPEDVPAETNQKTAGVTFSAQVRDVALAAMIHLIGQDPRDYGFTAIRPHKDYLYTPNTAGFESDELRDRALRQWLLWARIQHLHALDIDEIAIEGTGL